MTLDRRMIAFVRHGETLPNRQGRVLGRADPDLTEEGLRQAERVAVLLSVLQPAVLYTSPLARAQQTAAIIGEACGLVPLADDRLTEQDWGTWDLRPMTEIDDTEVEQFRRNRGCAPDGENQDMVFERVGSFCEEMVDRDGVVVAVTHGSPIKTAVAWAIGVPDPVPLRMSFDLASITRVSRGPRGPVLLSFNETLHFAKSD